MTPFAAQSNPPAIPRPPTTRFQGSKHKLLDWIWSHLAALPFQTCLDAFGGSGCVSHFLKGKGKSVTFNDALISCYLNGVALIENQTVRLNDDDVDRLLRRRDRANYDDMISRTFDGIYFTADENIWLDIIAQNIPRLKDRFKRAIAWHALFQSAMAKRPYNLFHRRNLYMRLAPVARTFGNKATWDKPFEEHFRQFVKAANVAIFQGAACRAINEDATKVEGDFDLVYIDPPYLNRNGVGVDYHGFYHFLEGLADYSNWAGRIDLSSRHRRLLPIASPWNSRGTIHQAFADVFLRYPRSIIAVSYRSDGIPSVEELAGMLRAVRRKVTIHTLDRGYKYALSTNAASSEVMLIGKPRG
jgi:adenine-specific DNA methylase